MSAHRLRERVLAGRARRAHSRHDPAAGRVQLLVGGAGGPQGELLDAVVPEARVRVAVDEARNDAQAAAVQLLDVARERVEVPHAADVDDPSVLAEHVRVVDHLGLVERSTAKRRGTPRRAGELLEVTDQQPPHRGGLVHPFGAIGGTRPCSRAASTASA